ncbi:MAG TPA: helix-turn-helix domain-containing protein [Candidatus Faecimonas gallistercoris]|nr:helix-turn-helix domain-containing protein [Candidatus Faecimonas gallistercoris]
MYKAYKFRLYPKNKPIELIQKTIKINFMKT